MKALIWIIVLGLITLGVYWIVKPDSKEASVPNTSSDNQSTSGDTTPAEEMAGQINASIDVDLDASPKTVTVIYNSNGFSPSEVTIKRGDTVRFSNQVSVGMWVASAAHPTHSVYDGTNLTTHCAARVAASFDSCRDIPNGQSFSFTFNKTGSWNYHNHSAAGHTGRVIVQ